MNKTVVISQKKMIKEHILALEKLAEDKKMVTQPFV